MQFSEGFVKINPSCGCGSFAVPQHQYDRWHKIGSNGQRPRWYCPYCKRCRVFTGESEEAKLNRQLESERDRVSALREEKRLEEQLKRDAEKRYRKIRDRVKNGVCPCCDQTFENLTMHMRTKHPDFGIEKTMKTLRLAYGLTQRGLADELNLPETYISLFENDRPVPAWARTTINQWLDAQAA